MAMPRSSAAAITSSSRTLPPGWITAAAPASASASSPSRKGKNASDATADPCSDRPAVFAAKKNVRVLQIDLPPDPGAGRNSQDTKRVGSGLLIQTADIHELDPDTVKVVTVRQPTAQQMQDLLFAWKVAKYVKSNAIVFCAGGMTLGVGAGQMSRLDSARIARIKAEAAGLSLAGSAVASDAFFPFRDGLDVVIDVGATSVIQPGGSMRDDEVIAAANERDVAMVFTGVRHFRH